MGETGVSGQDITLLRDILDLAHPRSPGRSGASATEVTFEVLDLLERLLGTDWASFNDMEIAFGRRFSRSHLQMTEQGERLLMLAPEVTALDALGGSEIIAQHWWGLAGSLVDRTGVACVTSIRTTFSASDWVNHPVSEGFARVDETLLAYPLPGGRSLRLRTGRDTGQPYGLRELTLLELLLPHLRPMLQATIDEHAESSAAGSDPELTARQREVLHLVALGMANKQVGRQLGISEGTVRKHLESAYGRIGAQSRTEAVLWLRAHEDAATG